jgi:hypothetical protein
MASGHQLPGLGEKVDDSRITKGTVPVVLQVQPSGYIPLTTPEQLRQFEAELKKFTGLDVKLEAQVGTQAALMRACETCSCGCSDDCGYVRA